MDFEQTIVQLQVRNRQLMEENNNLKSMLNLLKENTDLRARMMTFNNGTLDDTTGGNSDAHLFFDEGQFRRDLQQTRSKHDHRTSSPINYKTFLQNSLYREQDDSSAGQDFSNDVSPRAAGPSRLLGEIAFQLDKRILIHIFQAHKRLYGFTLLNVREKIIEVSTHPATGQVDKGYQHHLTQRYASLMERLGQMGYKAGLHPLFSEFIVNTYGTLKEKPDPSRMQSYKDSNYLKNVILKIAPERLQKDLLLLLTCLCYMAMEDKKPLFLC